MNVRRSPVARHRGNKLCGQFVHGQFAGNLLCSDKMTEKCYLNLIGKHGDHPEYRESHLLLKITHSIDPVWNIRLFPGPISFSAFIGPLNDLKFPPIKNEWHKEHIEYRTFTSILKAMTVFSVYFTLHCILFNRSSSNRATNTAPSFHPPTLNWSL